MKLSRLTKIRSKNKKKRLGRGYGSTKGGHTVGRGTKGQKARAGHKIPRGFEGGQVPLYKRLPQIRGFRNPAAKDISAINLDRLNVFREGSKVTPESLVERGIVKKVPKHGIKILAGGKLTKKLDLNGFLYSEKAKEEIKKAGAKIS